MAGLFSFGGTAASSSSLNNTLSFSPVINVGDSNSAESRNKQKGSSEAAATTKDEFGMTASVGVGVGGGTGKGGPATSSRIGDVQPMKKKDTGNDNFFNDGIMSKINPMYAAGAVAVVGVGYYFVKKKKSK